MSCCKHPLSTILYSYGYKEAAKLIDKVASGEHSLDFLAKKDLILQTILDNLNISPNIAKIVAGRIIDIFDSGILEHREWSAAQPILNKRLSHFVHAKELAKLEAHWQSFKDILMGTP